MSDDNVIDITDMIFMFSIDTQKYGKLNFYIIDGTVKKDELSKIISKQETDIDIKKILFKKTFKENKNNINIKDIDLTEITDEEYNNFIKEYFEKQFYKYSYDNNLSIKENIEKAFNFEDEKIIEESHKLADTLSMKLDSLKTLGASSLSTMTNLNNSISRLFEKPKPINMPPINFEPILHEDPSLKYCREIENILRNYSNLQLQVNNQLNEQVHTLSETLIDLIKVNNSLQEQEYNSVQQQADDSKKESKRANILSMVAITISILALLFDIIFNIYSSNQNDKFTKQIEDKKIELLQSLSEDTKQNGNKFKEEFENLNSSLFNISENDITLNSSITELQNNQKEIIREIKSLKKKENTTK
ncbi:hypothetical protein SAMN04487977_11085 [Treponema bryantii]|uniref:Uncharacterized protein n=1 Tax=Treponema bryantii TaxID=163 RepID=A0A1H9IS64_9SPIR|nr:hypothetical protein [Treponema bryantii]SEQ77406.1 hypothetical protein SAMN04487977_11085 [Treponema bryantii]